MSPLSSDCKGTNSGLKALCEGFRSRGDSAPEWKSY
ncbi:rCG24500 [Rattus norvegicus]|uniref:RCG24500 n=1 Tax=Rattus norvegicus TaxID=10116 RepID=A6KJ69_RAT|nr:rCG24500 [Rattus norvegicus]